MKGHCVTLHKANNGNVADIISDIMSELERGDAKYGPHTGPRRSFGVLRAELYELQTEIEAEDKNPKAIRAEAIQVAAMAIKLIRDAT